MHLRLALVAADSDRKAMPSPTAAKIDINSQQANGKSPKQDRENPKSPFSFLKTQ